MKHFKIWVIFLNLFILIAYINWSTCQKEVVLENGILALFELAPKDPRSLMQGDYMDLRYKMARRLDRKGEIPKKGYCVFIMDENKIADKVRFQNEKTPLNEGEYLLSYFKNDNQIRLGAESYFFEEGTGHKFEVAKYGGLRIDTEGKSILVGLYDKTYQLIE